MFFETKRSETENRVFQRVFPRKQQQSLISDTKKWRNEEKQSEKKLKGVKQNEKPFFKTQKKTKKTWNINQCKKRLDKKGNRENSFFLENGVFFRK